MSSSKAQTQAGYQAGTQAENRASIQAPNHAADWLTAMSAMSPVNFLEALPKTFSPQNFADFPGQNILGGAPLINSLEHLPLKFDAARVRQLQSKYHQDLTQLWADFFEGKVAPKPVDRRFGSQDWQGMHAYLADLYLLNADYLTGLADSVEADAKSKAKLKFATQQMIDAMAPSNYLATNPEALKKIIDTQGESLQLGLMNLLADWQKGRISQSDERAFEVGRNVAVTEGAVVYQNEIFQLIHYQPRTAMVHERPLLIVPPCINKFYILDLQPDSSLVRYALDQGQNVFLMSWRNTEAAQAHLRWDDYVEEGCIRAMQITHAICKKAQLNLVGFCVGGTLVTTALAVLAARGEQLAASLCLLTTFLDFSDTGVMDVFIDEDFVRKQECSIGGLTAQGHPGGPVGVLQGRELANTFSMLRPNDLVWNYVVNNYLKGQPPVPFDLLYWNSDGTNLPGPFFSWYLRNTYLENNLKVPGKVKVCGVPLDFGAIKLPTYVYASREDHIVPWTSVYANTRLLKGPKRFVLGASGHIAGVINPPGKNKRSYWTYAPPQGRFPEQAESWWQSVSEVPGSWWPDWAKWLAVHAGRKIKAPSKLGNAQYRPIEAAPGSYVKVRAA